MLTKLKTGSYRTSAVEEVPNVLERRRKTDLGFVLTVAKVYFQIRWFERGHKELRFSNMEETDVQLEP